MIIKINGIELSLTGTEKITIQLNEKEIVFQDLEKLREKFLTELIADIKKEDPNAYIDLTVYLESKFLKTIRKMAED